MGTSLTASGVQFPDNSVQSTPAFTGFRNRIINGDMKVYQRNSGAAFTLTKGSFDTILDRWKVTNTATNNGSVTVQQDNTTSPYSYGFSSSLKITNTTGGAAAASDNFSLYQGIEGLFVSDLAWGTSSAKPVTVSFYVKCSTTGTFGVSFRNSAANRSYVAAFTIYTANGWQYVSLTIPGDTTGTWAVDTNVGIYLSFSLGVGSNYQTTADSWKAGNYFAVTGQTSLCTISGATFDITGIQLEKGSSATDFEFRPYPLELAMCQRYYEVIEYIICMVPWSSGTQVIRFRVPFAVEKRSTPVALTLSAKDGGTGSIGFANNGTRSVIMYASGNYQDVISYPYMTISAEF